MGIVLSTSIAVVAEVQALWVAAFLTGRLDGDSQDNRNPARKGLLNINNLSREELDQNVSDDVVWRNITGGGLAIDTIHVSCLVFPSVIIPILTMLKMPV